MYPAQHLAAQSEQDDTTPVHVVTNPPMSVSDIASHMVNTVPTCSVVYTVSSLRQQLMKSNLVPPHPKTCAMCTECHNYPALFVKDYVAYNNQGMEMTDENGNVIRRKHCFERHSKSNPAPKATHCVFCAPADGYSIAKQAGRRGSKGAPYRPQFVIATTGDISYDNVFLEITSAKIVNANDDTEYAELPKECVSILMPTRTYKLCAIELDLHKGPLRKPGKDNPHWSSNGLFKLKTEIRLQSTTSNHGVLTTSKVLLSRGAFTIKSKPHQDKDLETSLRGGLKSMSGDVDVYDPAVMLDDKNIHSEYKRLYHAKTQLEEELNRLKMENSKLKRKRANDVCETERPAKTLHHMNHAEGVFA